MLLLYKSYKKGFINCFRIWTFDDKSLNDQDLKIIIDLIESENIQFEKKNYIEVGPRLSMVTPWCTNVLTILRNSGVESIERIEKSLLIAKNIFNKTDHLDPLTDEIYNEETNFSIKNKSCKDDFYFVDDIKKENNDKALGFDEDDLKYYKEMFDHMKRNPTNLELFDLSQSNSEHSRHWFFKGRLFKENGKKIELSLFDMIKGTQTINNNSLVAFSDNSSAIKGFSDIKTFLPNLNLNGKYVQDNLTLHPTFTAETHNFPTSVCPFPGAATGTGGRIRDGQSIGRGGLVTAGTIGYSVGNLKENKSKYYKKNIKTLIEASNGSSDYGNKFGEPVINGYLRVFGNGEYEYIKPILFSGGIGMVYEEHLFKEDVYPNLFVVKLGGLAYKIGIGGGSASSRNQDKNNLNEDIKAVQRGDPEMENKLNRVVRSFIEMKDKNPILSIHNQGAGGTANVTKEIVYSEKNGTGGKIFLDKILMGDTSMSDLELWISEFQEQHTILVDKSNMEIVDKICKRENLPYSVIGFTTNNRRLKVYNSSKSENKKLLVDFDLDKTLGKMPQKIYILEKPEINIDQNIIDRSKLELRDVLIRILMMPTVGSKRFLVNKVDRSVTGLIAQQQCVGPLHTPLSDYCQTVISMYENILNGIPGIVSAIGEQPIKGLLDPKKMARLTVGEMLTNMVFAKISSIKDIKCSGNWMWPIKKQGEMYRLYKACKEVARFVKELGFAFDGGKDSLSMIYKDKDQSISSPGTLVVSGYVTTKDVNIKVTPDFKKPNSRIVFVDISQGELKLGGSAFLQLFGHLYEEDPIKECPDVNTLELYYTFIKIQKLLDQHVILAGHDRSDGGLITTILEMSFASNLGFELDLNVDENKIFDYLFNEGLGLILEVTDQNYDYIDDLFGKSCHVIGKTLEDDKVLIKNEGKIILESKMTELRSFWEKPSMDMDNLQTDPGCVKQEYEIYKSFRQNIKYHISFKELNFYNNEDNNFKVAIIRDEGSNGDREMATAFKMAKFDVYDVCINDMIKDDKLLDSFNGLAFVGGFSYSDVLGAGKGWYTVIKNNQQVKNQFQRFYEREDTFSLGVCNGCQLMSHLGWIPKIVKLIENDSGRFESRFPTVKINKSNSILLKGMEDSLLGIWSANSQGKFVIDEAVNPNLICLQYVDEHGFITEEYPYNPSGSFIGIAGVCSKDGRHLAMMPHPERSFLTYQLPYKVGMELENTKYSPWFQMFLNAHIYLENKSMLVT